MSEMQAIGDGMPPSAEGGSLSSRMGYCSIHVKSNVRVPQGAKEKNRKDMWVYEVFRCGVIGVSGTSYASQSAKRSEFANAR